MSTFVLIHGANHGGWCWYKVKTWLESKGHIVYTPDLPGNSKNDPVPLKDITLERCISSIVNLIDTIDGNVILVGHSFGGAIISGVVELIKDRVQKLVYVCALVPKHGDKISSLLKSDTESQLMSVYKINEQEMIIELLLDKVDAIIYNGCQKEDIECAKNLLIQQPLIPMVTPMKLDNSNYKTVPRIGIICTEDNALTPKYQEQMYRDAGCKPYYMQSAHAPFFSNADELCSILISNLCPDTSF
jgi:predicted alpha/beta hydrolase family esterase